MAADFPSTPRDHRSTRRNVLPTFDARLVAARTLTPTVRELAFERVDSQPMVFAPGQWVSMLLGNSPEEEGRTLKRSYSIASAPEAGSTRFEVAVTRVQEGIGSIRLHDLPIGTVIPMIGPQGFFTREASSATPSLMIATGTGVTPMRSMLRATLGHADASRAPVWLLLGVRREEDLLYRAEFEEAARTHSFFRFEPTLSQPAEGWTGRRGYVQTHVAALWKELAARRAPAGAEGHAALPHAFICGLEKMVGSVRAILRQEQGLPREQVHSERYD